MCSSHLLTKRQHLEKGENMKIQSNGWCNRGRGISIFRWRLTINLKTGIMADKNVAKGLLNSSATIETLHKDFANHRLREIVKDRADFYKLIRTPNITSTYYCFPSPDITWQWSASRFKGFSPQSLNECSKCSYNNKPYAWLLENKWLGSREICRISTNLGRICRYNTWVFVHLQREWILQKWSR